MSLRFEITEEPRGKWSVTAYDDAEDSFEDFPPKSQHGVMVLLAQLMGDAKRERNQ